MSEDTLAGVPLVPKMFPTKTIKYRNRQLRLYSLKWLAVMCHRHPQTFYRLEKEGSMPRPIFDIGDAVRWYTAAEIKGYAKLFKAAKLRPGRIYIGTVKASYWFQTNAAAFKAKLKTFIEDHTDKVPEKLDNEDDIIQYVADRKQLVFSDKEIELLVSGRRTKISSVRNTLGAKNEPQETS
jgi:predicted DNA-binding transcriptional regulator AlpA